MSHDQPLPGPWYTDLEHEHTMVFAANKIAVADCAPYYASPYEAVCQANARIIKCAPQMAEMLDELEWGGMTEAESGGWVASCPWCGAERQGGKHHEACDLAELIAKLEGRA